MAIRFFTAKYEILQVFPNGHSFFTAKCKILKTVPKRPAMFLQRNIEFWKLYQTVICIFHKEIRNLTIYHQFSFVS